jgi:iron(III) transport system ATP-binding protein
VPQPIVSVRGISKSFAADESSRAGDGRVRAVDDVSFDVRPGEMFTLLGPSGCGKTTTLRSIAGLEDPDRGRITVDGTVFFDGARGVRVAPESRGLGMVFQSYAIWPHMTVFRNVSLPLAVLPRRRRPRTAAIRERVDRALAVTGLAEYADRSATKLSGGQQQRLALARALVVEPRVMLLDEPLSNLDATLRESMRFELKRLQRELGLTALYVTHDQTEALSMSSRIAVLQDGEVRQLGRPREVYERPESRFVADFIGVTNSSTGRYGSGATGGR